jgi:hypothetical protein
MSKEEIKLQCLRVACEVLGVYQSNADYVAENATKVMPSVDEVIKKAKQIYDYVIGE